MIAKREVRLPRSTAGDFEGTPHGSPELLDDLFVEPFGQGQALSALAFEVRPLLCEPVFFETQEDHPLTALAL